MKMENSVLPIIETVLDFGSEGGDIIDKLKKMEEKIMSFDQKQLKIIYFDKDHKNTNFYINLE